MCFTGKCKFEQHSGDCMFNDPGCHIENLNLRLKNARVVDGMIDMGDYKVSIHSPFGETLLGKIKNDKTQKENQSQSIISVYAGKDPGMVRKTGI